MTELKDVMTALDMYLNNEDHSIKMSAKDVLRHSLRQWKERPANDPLETIVQNYQKQIVQLIDDCERLQKENKALRQMVKEELYYRSDIVEHFYMFGVNDYNWYEYLTKRGYQKYPTAEECLDAELQKRMGE